MNVIDRRLGAVVTVAAESLRSRVRLAISAPNLGGVDSLIIRPAATSHSGMFPEDIYRLGINDSLIGLSVGLEAPEDLIEDLEQALEI